MAEAAAAESCTCPECVSLCEDNPGWMTPAEARRAIEAGLGGRLMVDWLEPCSEVGNERRLYLLCPAAEGCEGGACREFSTFELLTVAMVGGGACKGRCTFLKDGLCEIHSSGFKPVQCRKSFECRGNPEYPDNYAVARLWDTEEGRAVMAMWPGELRKEE
jgi:Fe-S-cluster containining protein